jgi:hypothetical protein
MSRRRMNSVSYDTIAPNIADVDVEGSSVQVTWKCPATGREVAQSSASMSPDPSLVARVQASVKRSIASEAIYGAARVVAGLLGGAVGRVVSNAVYTAAGDIDAKLTAGVDYTASSRATAIADAFELVKDRFVWDAKQERFVARQ